MKNSLSYNKDMIEPKDSVFHKCKKACYYTIVPRERTKNEREEKTMKKMEKFLEGLYESYLHR